MEQIAFGKKLIEIRNTKGLTQDELAKKCKVSLRTIQRIESGAVKPRAFTIRAISEVLEIDFFDASNYTDGDAMKVQKSNTKRYSRLLWHLKDLFNLKTDTMKNISILSAFFGITILGTLFITNSLNGQKTENKKIKASERSNFLIFNSDGISYKFPKGEVGMGGEFNDTIYYFLKEDLIQNYNNNIFLNRSFVDKALEGDTVIYKNRKVFIKSAYKFLEFSSHGLYYKIQEGELKMSSNINQDTANYFLQKDLIQEHNNSIFLNRFFVGKVIVGDTIVYQNRKVFIKTTTAKFITFIDNGINYKYPNGKIEMSSIINDTTYHFLKDGLLQEYKNNVFLNRSFVGKASVGDTVIYKNQKVFIKSAYSE